MLRWLLELVPVPEGTRWIEEAAARATRPDTRGTTDADRSVSPPLTSPAA
jgi:hypothetical protein